MRTERRTFLAMMAALPFGAAACGEQKDTLRTVGLIDPTIRPEIRSYVEQIAAEKSYSLQPYSQEALEDLDLIRKRIPKYLLASSAVSTSMKDIGRFYMRGVGLTAQHGKERMFISLSQSRDIKEVGLYYGGIKNVARIRFFVSHGDLRNPMTQRTVEVSQLQGKTVDSWSLILGSQLKDRTADNFARPVVTPSIPALQHIYELLDEPNHLLFVSERDTDILRDHYDNLGKAA